MERQAAEASITSSAKANAIRRTTWRWQWRDLLWPRTLLLVE